MTTDAYKQALAKAEKELAEAMQQRDYWTVTVARLQQLIKGLASHVGQEGEAEEITESANEIGLQEVVLTCVRASHDPISAIEVRNQLQTVSYDLSRYSNPLAVIHGALKRLSKSGQIIDMKDGTYVRSALYDRLLDAGMRRKQPGMMTLADLMRATPIKLQPDLKVMEEALLRNSNKARLSDLRGAGVLKPGKNRLK